MSAIRARRNWYGRSFGHFETHRLGLLVDIEWTARESRKLSQRLRHATLRYPASLEDIDFSTPRGLSREVALNLGTGGWIRDHHYLLITGPTGIGKSWLASALVQSACRHGFSATYVRAPRLLHDLAVSCGDGSYGRLLAKLRSSICWPLMISCSRR